MIGKIIGISNNLVDLEITTSVENIRNLINFHVVFDQPNNKIVGEILSVSSNKATALLVGEITNNVFLPGVSKKPFLGAPFRYITSEELMLILGTNPEEKIINIGRLPQYNGYKVNVSVNQLLTNHFTILGNTGSGKSYSLSRLLQNLFLQSDSIPKNANIFIFDAYGEYHRALKVLDNNENTNFKVYTTKVSEFEEVDKQLLKIPPWLLDVDDYAVLLEATKATQLPIIQKALRLVSIFSKQEEEVIVYKNDIISRAIIEILYSGGTPMQVRDQIFAVLTTFNTKELNLDSKVTIPGWTRTLRQCLIIDKDGKIQEIQLVGEFFKKFVKEGLELTLPDGSYPYTLDHLKEAFEFALISEGILKSDKVYDEANVLRVRLHALVNSNEKKMFDLAEYMTKKEYITKLVNTTSGNKAQIINFNISHVSDRLAKTLVKIISKMLFQYSAENENRASFPVHIFLEEAHRYVQNDNDINVLGYNIFERITKEGRKYGVILGMVSQRPSEISETAISQCTNFLIFRIQHPKDLSYIKDMIPNMTEELLGKFKVLQPGTCIAFGNAFKLPLLLKIELPNPLPDSQNADISRIWYQ